MLTVVKVVWLHFTLLDLIPLGVMQQLFTPDYFQLLKWSLGAQASWELLCLSLGLNQAPHQKQALKLKKPQRTGKNQPTFINPLRVGAWSCLHKLKLFGLASRCRVKERWIRSQLEHFFSLPHPQHIANNVTKKDQLSFSRKTDPSILWSWLS